MVSCKDYVAIRKEAIKNEVASLMGVPCLAVVQVGDDPASNVYIRNKKKACNDVGIEVTHIKLPSDADMWDVENALLNIRDHVDGIMIQLPLPDHLDIDRLLLFIPPDKDIDGFRRDSLFSSCTPKGIIDYLEYNNVEFEGKHVAVLGRSKIVGLPLTNMLIERGATVTCCNSKTKKLSNITRQADIIVSAIGKPKYLDYYYFGNDQIIIDVGINRDINNKLCGDVDYDDVTEICGAYVTPVPNGVGKLTVCSLLENVVEAYKRNRNGNRS